MLVALTVPSTSDTKTNELRCLFLQLLLLVCCLLYAFGKCRGEVERALDDPPEGDSGTTGDASGLDKEHEVDMDTDDAGPGRKPQKKKSRKMK